MAKVFLPGLSYMAVAVIGFGQQGAFETREAFDAMLARVPASLLDRDNERGGIAWGTAYYMGALVSMHQATGDTSYLDLLIQAADRVLAMRDSGTGVTDFRGIAHPGWTAGANYSVGEIEVPTATGEPALYIRTAFYGFNNETVAIVSSAEEGNRFHLRIRNERYGRDGFFENLSMNPASPRFAPTVVAASEMGDPFDQSRLHVRSLLDPGRPSFPPPAPIEISLQPNRALWAVHQGMIVYPMIAFARLVEERPELSAEARYVEKAREYTAATVAIMETLEAGWRENAEGEGWYIVPRGTPIWFDGLDVPHNHFLAVGRAMVHLAAVTREDRWRDRVVKMARTFRNDLELCENGAYTWPYWRRKGAVFQGWGPDRDLSDHVAALHPVQRAEDYSHASIDVHFAWLCHLDGIVFTRTDMERFAATFLRNLLSETKDGRPTLHELVDGTGRLSRHDQRGPEWVLLGMVEPEVFRVFKALREGQPWTGNAVQLLASGNLNLVSADLRENR